MSVHAILRDLRAAQRRNQREAARQYKALLAEQTRWAKAAHHARGQYEVAMHDGYLDFITSLHRDATDPWDWRAVLHSSPPEASDAHEEHAMHEHYAYKPTLMEKLSGKEAERRREIQVLIDQAKLRDAAINRQRYEEWEWYRRLAHGVLSGNPEAYTSVLENIAPFDELEQSNATVRCVSHSPTYMEAFVTVRDESAIPRVEKRLLANGSVSSKAMTDGKYWAYYQDYVCGAALRVARELFHLLPLQTVCVHVGAPMLNSGTGHYEAVTILSVEFPRDPFLEINFERADASDATERFSPNMKFKKTTGFSPVERVMPMTSIEQVG
jgi:hypothetical protein